MSQPAIRPNRQKSTDDIIIELAAADLSAEEISRRIGGVITPARVMLRTRELLKAGDWLDLAQKEQALLRILHMNVMEMREEALTVDSAKLQLAYIKEILERLDKRRATTDENLNTYNANVGRQIGSIVDEALAYMQGALREQIDPVKWRELVEEAMTIAWTRIAAKQAVEQ